MKRHAAATSVTALMAGLLLLGGCKTVSMPQTPEWLSSPWGMSDNTAKKAQNPVARPSAPAAASPATISDAPPLPNAPVTEETLPEQETVRQAPASETEAGNVAEPSAAAMEPAAEPVVEIAAEPTTETMAETAAEPSAAAPAASVRTHSAKPAAVLAKCLVTKTGGGLSAPEAEGRQTVTVTTEAGAAFTIDIDASEEGSDVVVTSPDGADNAMILAAVEYCSQRTTEQLKGGWPLM